MKTGKPIPPTYYHWDTDILSYKGVLQSNGNAEESIDFVRGGYINIEVEDSPNEVLEIPFLHFYLVITSTYGFKHYGEFEEILDEGDYSDGVLNAFTYVEFKSQDNLPTSYLALPKNLEVNPFIDLDGLTLTSRISNPSLDDGLFDLLLTSDYEFSSVEEIDFGLEPRTQPVPEPSATSGILVIGVLVLGVIAKRQLSRFWSHLKTREGGQH